MTVCYCHASILSADNTLVSYQTQWSPIWSVIRQVDTKWKDSEPGVWFVNHNFD